MFSTNLLRGGFLQCQHRTATVSQYCRMTLDYFYRQAGELFSFYRIPKALFLESRFQNLSTDAKTLYGILLDRMSLSAKNGWLDEQGRVFIIFTIEDVKRALCCADNKATKLLRELEEFGLIERKRRGLGRPSVVYVKNFSAESSNSRFKNRENHESGGFKTTSQDPAKSRCNKTDENNTEMSEPYPFYSEEDDAMSKREQLEGYFHGLWRLTLCSGSARMMRTPSIKSWICWWIPALPTARRCALPGTISPPKWYAAGL